MVNAEQVRVTGKKFKEKIYRHHTGYHGGLKEYAYEELMAKRPEEILRRAVKGMLPKNKLGKHMLTRLRVFKGAEHIHAPQKPVLY